MRRLTDVTITSADRPAPPRGKSPRPAPASAPQKAARPRRKRVAPLWWRRLRAALAFGSALAVVGGGALWLIRSGVLATAQKAVSDRTIELSLRSGLRVDDIEIEGQKRISAADIAAALDIRQGEPILGVDLAAARARLAALPGIRTVTIERRLPAELHVYVTEREPIAIWQNDGKYQLVDADGQPAGDNIGDFPGLPLVVGAGAPERAATLLDLLRSEPALMERVKASQWVSERHWSIVMNGPAGDIEVRLPENEPAAAWHELARLETEQKLLDRKITMVDMRLADRLVVRVPGGIEQQPAKSTPNTPGRHKAPGRDA